jgi:hypothetical protein
MSDQQAAEVAGLNPTTAAYTKAKPRVQAWMQQYRAAMDKLIIEQEAENLRLRSTIRERVLNRLWAIADLAADQTRNSMVSQMKALAMIVAIEGLIPVRGKDRPAVPAQKPLAPAPSANIYQAEWLHNRNQSSPSGSAAGLAAEPAPEEAQQENVSAGRETAFPLPEPVPSPQPTPDSCPAALVAPRPLTFAEENASPYTSFVPDTRGSFTLPRNPFSRRRR